MNTLHSLHAWRLALLRSLLTLLVLAMGLGGVGLLSGCERRVGEDPRLVPSQPRPDSQPGTPSR
jgi:hypothetical protein